MKIKRLIPANESKFYNTEEKLKEFFDSYKDIGFRIPLSINHAPSDRYIDFYITDMNDVIGYVESFSDTDMEVTILRDDIIKNIDIDKLRVNIIGKVTKVKLNKIIKICLTTA